MAYSSIIKPSDFFSTKLYTGNGGTQSITGVGHQPDFNWIKCRSNATDHALQDIVRGNQKSLQSNSNSADATVTNGVTAFTSDGFNLGAGGDVNTNGRTYCSWNWKAGTGQGSSNTDGSINTAYTSVNTTAGFSVSQYAGTESLATVGHGLGVAPSMMIIKDLSYSRDWAVYHQGLGNTSAVYLNLRNDKSDSSAWWNNTSPTSTVFTINTRNENNNNGSNYIAYCFAEKQGYSKFGTYTGNNNADGTFVYTGFKPAWLMVFAYTAGNENWMLVDNKRDGYNVENEQLFPNTNDDEESNNEVDLVSNGFKLRRANTRMNGAIPYIYAAFAEEPFVASNYNVATAR